MMREDAVRSFRTVALFVERARAVVVVLAVFAFGALSFQIVLAEKFRICNCSASARRTNTFSLGFAASFAAT